MEEKKYVTEGSGLGSITGRQTTCSNMVCPHRGKCRVNIYEDGLICPHYKSQQQWIYGGYVRDCEKRGEEPMSRSRYFEF